MPKFLAVIALTAMLAMPAKWGRHKKQKSLVIPQAPFSIEPDPRDAAARRYLQKKMDDLREDEQQYPFLKGQIQSLMDDASALELIPIADPSYTERFAQFHTSLVSLWTMESNDAI